MTLLGALVLEWLFGDPKTRWHPVAIFGAFAQRIERALYADRSYEGAVAWVLAVVPLVFVIYWVHWAARQLNPLLGIAVGSLILWMTLGWRSLFEHVRAVQQAGSLSEARAQVSQIVGRDVDSISALEVRSAALESLAENASDAVMAPIFWGVVGGPAAAAAYRMINTLDAMWGHRNRRYARFGCLAARVDDAVNWLPARLTAALYFIVSLRFPSAEIVGQAGAHPSVNAGWPESALAHVLVVKLGGPVQRSGIEEDRPWLGPAEASGPTEQSFAEGLRLTHWILVAASIGGVVVWL